MYHALLYLPVLLTDVQNRRLQEAKNKYLPKPEDLNPNMRFVDNLFVKALRECPELEEYLSDNTDADASSWRDSDAMLDNLLD